MRVKACGLVAAFLISLPSAAVADSICGPGKHLASNAWACLPGEGGAGRVRVESTVRPRPDARIGAGLAFGGAVLSLVESLASGTRITDDAGPAPSRHDNKPLRIDVEKKWHGTRSREYNRQGVSLQRAGDFEGARRAFDKAADEAREAGNWDDFYGNQKNTQIANALYWLHKGYQAEQAGKATSANISYKMGIDAAKLAGRDDVVEKLSQANDNLIRSKGNDKGLRKNADSCDMINGEYACRVAD